MDSRGARLRALLKGPDILIRRGVYDGYSVRVCRMLAGAAVVERPDLPMPFGEHNALMGIDFLDRLENRYAAGDTKG